MILWWNQSNKVYFTKIKHYQNIIWRIMPWEVWVEWAIQKAPKGKNWKTDITKIPDWAIICS
jgi:hypothetical protein